MNLVKSAYHAPQRRDTMFRPRWYMEPGGSPENAVSPTVRATFHVLVIPRMYGDHIWEWYDIRVRMLWFDCTAGLGIAVLQAKSHVHLRVIWSGGLECVQSSSEGCGPSWESASSMLRRPHRRGIFWYEIH